MALDCVMQYVVSPISSFALGKVKDYVSYITSYDDNINSLIEELEKLHGQKEDLKCKVSSETNNLKTITLSAKIWLKKVSKLSQNEELKKLVVCEQKIAEKVVMLMEEKDLMKVLRKGDEMIGVVIKVMMELHDEDDDDDKTKEFKKRLKGDVLEVLKETTHKFKKMMTEDIKVAMIMMTILKQEDVEKLSEGNEEKWKKMFDEESSEIHDDDESSIIADVVNLVRPFEKLIENADFMKDLPEDIKFGVKMMDDLWKGRSAELKDESAIEKHKDKYGHRHHCCYYFKHFHHRYGMSKLAEKMAKVIKPLCDNSPTSVTSQINIEDMEAIPSGFVVGVESREQYLQNILTKLQDEKVNCVGVYGMGGIGKTTLVKEVKSRAKGIFDKIVFAAVSESPNIERIQDQLAEGLDLPLVDVHSTGSRAQKLYNMLLGGNKEKKERDQGERKGKIKILIILDNMWHKLNLSEVGIPNVSTNESCKILLTSRDRNVCEMMGVKDENIIELGLLNDNESKILFQHHVKKTIDEGDFKLEAQKLLKKCFGLPLNIMATSNVLKEKDSSTWKHFVDELEKPTSSEVSSVRHDTYKILETSYKFLESEEKKTFFLLACLSPIDSGISVDNLMRYGVGLDLFQKVDKLSEALEQASKWVSELVYSSLLLKDDDSRSHVKIHDDVRASAMSFAENDKQQHKFLVQAVRRWMCKESFNKYTAISLLSGAHDFSRLNAVKAELLQILLLKGMRSDTSELADGFFQGMPNLKVLHLSCMNLEPRLPKSIVELKNLKTLQLEQCKLGDISLMCKLTELIVVSLRDSTLAQLPIEMGKLVNLRIFDMDGCIFESPTNTNVIAKISSLEGLYLFDKFHKWATNYEFNELPHLNLLEVMYQLDLNNYNLIQLPLSRFFEHLDRFCIVFTLNDAASSTFKRFYRAPPLQHRALQFTGSQSRLRSANLLNIQALKDSSCIEALIKRTEYLTFYLTNLKKNLVPDFDKDGFRDLKHLDVTDCDGMECVINTDIDGSNNLIAFQNLEYLTLNRLKGLKMICKGNAPSGSRMFSNLRHLELYKCYDLEYALPLALLPKNLTEIKIWDCSGMKFIFNDNDYQHNKNVAIELPLLKLLTIDSTDLVSLVGPVAKADAFFNTKINCPSLEHLTVDSCSTTMYLWSKELDISSFRNLKVMKISHCIGLQSLASASVFCALVQLEILTISLSSGLEEIITKETKEQKIIEFRQLRELELDHLDSLKSFYEGSSTVKFPKLKKLEMKFLPKMTAFVGSVDPSTTLFSDKVEFPYLEELEVIGVIKDTNMQLWNWDRAMKDEDARKLRKVKIESIKGLRSIPNIISTNIYSLHLYDVSKMSEDKVLFSLSTSESQVVQLPKLEELYVQSFPRLKTLFESEDNDGNSATAHENGCKLKQLTLEELPELRIIPYNSFKNLRFLYIEKLNWKYVFPIDVVARGLEMLKELKIECCEKLDVVIWDDEKEGGDNHTVLRFPRLKTLDLRDLNIYSFSNRSYSTLDFSSLETLYINGCDKLEAFWSGPFVAPKLKEICIYNCNYIKWFLSGELTKVVELWSLQGLAINSTCCMKSFSATPLKAPKLREVLIANCRDMDWILPGYPNHDDVLDLPSLETLYIANSRLQTFSTGPLKAPKLTHAMINGRNFDMGELEFKQYLEGYKPKKDNKDEGDKQEDKLKSEEEIQESMCKEENHE